MPRPRDPRTRQRILDAAAPLFYERGIQGVGMAELSDAAGCGKSAVYREFDSKEDLVLGYLQQFARRREERDERVIAEAGSAREALVALVRGLAATSARPAFRGCPFRNYLREFDHPGTDASRFAERWLAGRRTTVRRLVRETVVAEPDLVADQVWLAMDGLWSSAPYRDRRRLGAAAVSLVEQLLAA